MQGSEYTVDEWSSNEAFETPRYVSDYVTNDSAFNVFLTTSKSGGKSPSGHAL